MYFYEYTFKIVYEFLKVDKKEAGNLCSNPFRAYHHDNSAQRIRVATESFPNDALAISMIIIVAKKITETDKD